MTPDSIMPESKIWRFERIAPAAVSIARRADAIGDNPLNSSAGLSYFSQITSAGSNAIVFP